MNKKEREIILNKYENILMYGDNSTIREFKSLLNMLGLENDKFKIENKVIADKNDLSPLIIDMYDMIINDLNKYNDVNEGIENRIKKVIYESNSWHHRLIQSYPSSPCYMLQLTCS